MPDLPGTIPLRHWCRSVLLVLAALLLTIFLIWTWRGATQARDRARTIACSSNLKGLGLAMMQYEEWYGHLPPAHINAPDGTHLHSWRAIATKVYHSDFLYDFSEPWNGPNNSKLGNSHFNPRCISDPVTQKNKRLTNYFVIVGKNTPFPYANTKSIVSSNHSKSLSDTILVAEAIGLDIEWLEPRDLEYDSMSFILNDPKRPSISSHHPHGSNACMADGSLRFLSNNINPTVLKQLLEVQKDAWRENEPENQEKN